MLSTAGLGTHAIMRATGKSKTCVWRWQERFMEAGIDGLLRDKTRPPGIAPIEEVRVRDIVALTLKPPPHEATHWTLRAMAGVSAALYPADSISSAMFAYARTKATVAL